MNNSEETVTCNREKALKRKQRKPVYEIYGAGGRSIRVYPYKCVIYSGVTAGSLSINNAAGSEMTIYYKDVVGIRYKRSGAAIGYLRFETASGAKMASGAMSHDQDDFFSENTFTFGADKDAIMEEVYEYIIGVFDELKSTPPVIAADVFGGINIEKLNALIEYHYSKLVREPPERPNMQEQEILGNDVADLKKDAADALKQFIDLRTEVSLLNESIIKNQERIDKLQNEITKLLSYGKSSGINEKIRLKVAESTGLELHLAELKEDKLRLEKKLEQAKENHSKKYQLLKEKQSEFLKVH